MRRVIAIVIALVLAVIGTVLVLGYVNTADARAIAGKQAVKVLIAKERIPAGTSVAKIRANDLAETVTMPAETLPSGVIGSFEKSADDLVVTAEVQANQLLLRGMFGEKVKATGGLSVPEGKLAVSVQLEAPQQVAGFVRPGATVAIFDTFNMVDDRRREPSGEGLTRKDGVNHATRILLSKVEVLAVGSYGVDGTKTSDGKTTDAKKKTTSKLNTALLVTVAVTQAEAERLVHAVQTGTLYLALVTESSDVNPGAGVDNHSLFK